MEWISVKDKLPKLSYIESDDEQEPYESYPVLVFSPDSRSEMEGDTCVAHLVKNQREDSFAFGEMTWEVYIPNGTIIDDIDFEMFTYWMPLPDPPKE